MITKIPYASHDEWLSIRHKYIGGSDAGTLLGLNPYSSPYALWAEKTGKISPFEGNTTTEVGSYLEEFVAQQFCRMTGKQVRRSNFTYVNEKYPWACANVDRLVVGEDAILEIKTTSNYEYMQYIRDGHPVPAWWCQLVHYMSVLEKKKAYLAVLLDCREIKILEFDFSESESEALMKAEEAFWSGNVLGNTPPAVDGTDAKQEAIKTIFADSADEKTDLTAVSDAVYAYIACSKQIKELETLKKQSQAQIQTFMQTAERGELSGVAGVTWRPQRRSSFDRESYEKDHGPIDGKYFTVTESRTFRLTNKNK